MDPFQPAEFLLKKGVILKATQVDLNFFFFNSISYSSCSLSHGSLTFCLCWLILDPPEFQSPPRGLSTRSQVPCDKVQVQIPSADSEELLGSFGKSCLGASRRNWRLPEMLRAGHRGIPEQELNPSATSLGFHLVLLFSRGFQLPSAQTQIYPEFQ